MRQILDELVAEIGRAGAERQHFAESRSNGLVEHGLTIRKLHGAGIAKTAHALERAEVMIEGAVFLHQHDNMLNVLDAAVLVIGGYGECIADAGRHDT